MLILCTVSIVTGILIGVIIACIVDAIIIIEKVIDLPEESGKYADVS
jgi:5-bromo-4-chloroindolyl phosphate hydrolysis protein